VFNNNQDSGNFPMMRLRIPLILNNNCWLNVATRQVRI
jgi:hypothetical protein